MIQGVLFDMDGVLYDTERLYLRAEVEAAHQMGVEMSPEYPKKFCGMTSRLMVAILEEDYGKQMDVTAYRKLTKTLTAAHIAKEGLKPMPHALNTLKWLKENGYKTSVASSTKTEIVKQFLEMSGFGAYFNAVVGGDQIENGKPAPDIFLFAAQKLGLMAKDCVAVEDSYNGIYSAFAAGCVAVMIPDVLPATTEMRQKATILSNLSQLPAFIKGASN